MTKVPSCLASVRIVVLNGQGAAFFTMSEKEGRKEGGKMGGKDPLLMRELHLSQGPHPYNFVLI